MKIKRIAILIAILAAFGIWTAGFITNSSAQNERTNETEKVAPGPQQQYEDVFSAGQTVEIKSDGNSYFF